MIKSKSILLGRGFKELQFGVSKDEVQAIMGEPDSIDNFTNDEPDLGESHVWYYNKPQLSFTFEEIDEFKLGNISVLSDMYVLRDLIRVGMTKEQVLDSLESLTFHEYAEEDHSSLENPNHSLVAVDEKSLYLWFDDDILNEIQWFPYYDEEEEIIWPV